MQAQCVGCLNFWWWEVRHGVADYLNFRREKADLVRDWKKHKKGNPRTGSGIPELIPVKIPIWGSVAANSDITILSILAAR